jgi:hypothetical protein
VPDEQARVEVARECMVTPLRPARRTAGRQTAVENAVRRIGSPCSVVKRNSAAGPGGEVDRQGVDDDLGEWDHPDGCLRLGRVCRSSRR